MRAARIRALAGRSVSGLARPTAVTIFRSPQTPEARTSQPRGQTRLWTGDITYLPTGEGWLYLAAVLDLATRKIVSWSMRDHIAHRVERGGVDDGRQAAATNCRADLPVGSRQPVRGRGLPETARRYGGEAVDEPHGLLLR